MFNIYVIYKVLNYIIQLHLMNLKIVQGHASGDRNNWKTFTETSQDDIYKALQKQEQKATQGKWTAYIYIYIYCDVIRGMAINERYIPSRWLQQGLQPA